MTDPHLIEILGPIALAVVGFGGIAVAAIVIHRLNATERCLACDEALRDGQEVYADVSGGFIHAACCGPERESYVGRDGNPLRDDEPIPTPWRWSVDRG